MRANGFEFKISVLGTSVVYCVFYISYRMTNNMFITTKVADYRLILKNSFFFNFGCAMT